MTQFYNDTIQLFYKKSNMKKLLFSLCVMLFGLGAYAQETAPEAKVNQAPAKVQKAPETPEQEAQKLVDMLTQGATYSDVQKKQIHEIAVNAVKKRKALASLKASNPSAYAQKEMDIFIEMSNAIKEIEQQ